MNCVEARNLIDSYLNRTISDHDCAGFISHVRGCRECYEELEIYMAIAEALRDQNDPGKRDYNFDRRIEADLELMEGNLKVRHYQQIVGRIIIGSAFIILILLLYFGLKSRREEALPAWETELSSEIQTDDEPQEEDTGENESVEGLEE